MNLFIPGGGFGRFWCSSETAWAHSTPPEGEHEVVQCQGCGFPHLHLSHAPAVAERCVAEEWRTSRNAAELMGEEDQRLRK